MFEPDVGDVGLQFVHGSARDITKGVSNPLAASIHHAVQDLLPPVVQGRQT